MLLGHFVRCLLRWQPLSASASASISIARAIDTSVSKSPMDSVVRSPSSLPQRTLSFFRNQQFSSLSMVPSSLSRDSERIRNIGIIAHVDAGKTTTCERMLFYSGVLQRLGDVDKGDTTMDFLELERERGITIQSAAISFLWKNHKINLIDTPGHVDFTIEVERSVRVQDGAVAIFDAVSGVQAQTETVWRQADRYQVARVCFINKMDRQEASVEKTISEIQSRLDAHPIMIQTPIPITSGLFIGIIDLITMELVTWPSSTGDQIAKEPLSPVSNPELYHIASVHRQRMFDSLTTLDDCFLELMLTNENAICEQDINDALRRVTIARKGVPVLIGSALKNKGVQPLLDAVINYLPSPLETPPTKGITFDGTPTQFQNKTKESLFSSPLVAFCFKVVHDEHKGLIFFVRVYSGTLKLNDQLVNSQTSANERIMRMFEINAESFTEVKEIPAGNIGAIIGLKNTKTGDTILSLSYYKTLKNDPHSKAIFSLSGVAIPAPVFFCSIEPERQSHQQQLDTSLQLLQKEDPSFQIRQDPDTGQTLISGMGQLHLEILHHRLSTHYKVPCTMGKVCIAYRYTIDREHDGPIIKEHTYSPTFRSVPTTTKEFVSLAVSVESNFESKGNFFLVDTSIKCNKESDRMVLNAIEDGVMSAFRQGVKYGFPLDHLKVTLLSMQSSGTAQEEVTPTNENLWRVCGMQAVLHAIRDNQIPLKLLEPVMNVHITLPSSFLGVVLSDLKHKRRANILAVDNSNNSPGSDTRVIRAEVPLKEIVEYSTVLRSLTQGTACSSMEFCDYREVSPNQEKTIINEMFGY